LGDHPAPRGLTPGQILSGSKPKEHNAKVAISIKSNSNSKNCSSNHWDSSWVYTKLQNCTKTCGIHQRTPANLDASHHLTNAAGVDPSAQGLEIRAEQRRLAISVNVWDKAVANDFQA
jgi:hypothetical protein